MAWLGLDAVRFRDEVYPMREMLARLKLVARRCGVWFKELSRDQRILIELVIMVKERVRSSYLAKLLAPIVKRILEASGGIKALVGEIAYKMKTAGLRLAQKLSQIAQAWGNKSAAEWPQDEGFIRYLAVMDLNRS